MIWKFFKKLVLRSFGTLFNNEIKTLKEIKVRQTKKNQEDINFNLVSIYSKLQTSFEKKEIVDDTTWNDLDMNSVFLKINRCLSPIGSQYLFHNMRVYKKSTLMHNKRFKRYKYFTENHSLSKKILLQLYKLRSENAFYIPNLLFKEIPQKPKFYFVFYILSFLSILSMSAVFFYPQFIFSTIFIFLINIFINLHFNRRISDYFIDASNLGKLLEVGVKISKFNEKELSQIITLKKHQNFSKSLIKRLGWLSVDKFSLNDLSAIIIDYFNYFCLFNVVFFIRSINFINGHKNELIQIYEAVSSLDAEISISSYLQSLQFYCLPEFNKANIIKTKDMYHPILIDPVSNSLSISNKSSLITGSNMAGKTTFIKTIGVNTIISQTLSFAYANFAMIPKNIVKSSIKKSDDINQSKSYYYSEIEAILQFIKLSNKFNNYIFLIDEIFKGTNTIERISAASSVLNYLSQNNMIFVTTHDIELYDLLNKNFNMYHFSEQIKSGKHFFDYKIKHGTCRTRNAIKLLEIKGYPDNIISNANSLAKKISNIKK